METKLQKTVCDNVTKACTFISVYSTYSCLDPPTNGQAARSISAWVPNTVIKEQTAWDKEREIE